jgi:hypothetical protein
LNCLLLEAFLKDVISETRRATAERGVNRADEEGNDEEGHGEEGHGASFVSSRKDACASGRNPIPSRIHADRARPVGRSPRHRLTSGRLPAS